jgi:enoyl-CoA hydratase/carnithine racemase
MVRQGDTMTEKTILYSKKEHTAWITLNRPQTGNFFDLAAAQELTEVCCQIKGDQDIHSVVISGAGKAFCSGGDFDFKSVGNAVCPAEAVAALDCPVIASIGGDALGWGLELALACDLRIAVDTAHFGLPQIADGLIPMNGGTQRLSRIAGRGKALEMVLTGESIDAQSALECGLVNRVVKAAELQFEVEALAAMFGAKAPVALRYAKEAVNKGLDLTLEQGLRLEADLYFLIHTTADRTEGIQSFLQKRQAKFKGQ